MMTDELLEEYKKCWEKDRLVINIGKCPKCENLVSRVKIELVDASVAFGQTKWNAISCLCPSCNMILSIQIDPVAIMNDTLKAIGKR